MGNCEGDVLKTYLLVLLFIITFNPRISHKFDVMLQTTAFLMENVFEISSATSII